MNFDYKPSLFHYLKVSLSLFFKSIRIYEELFILSYFQMKNYSGKLTKELAFDKGPESKYSLTDYAQFMSYQKVVKSYDLMILKNVSHFVYLDHYSS
jgi:hypothetical protein